MNKKREKEKTKTETILRRSEAIKKLSESDAIKASVRESIRRSKVLPKSKRPGRIKQTRMTAEEVTTAIEKEAEDVAELRKAMALGTAEESKNV